MHAVEPIPGAYQCEGFGSAMSNHAASSFQRPIEKNLVLAKDMSSLKSLVFHF
jgi:hypothetical protein